MALYQENEQARRFLNDALKRAEPFLSYIYEEIEKAGTPKELIWLPIVESAYRSHALSRAGALGLWQFIKTSALEYPLFSIDRWRDDRRNFLKATRAALHKLSYNYRKTGNSWLLALAAYNAGLGRVRRIMRRTGIKTFWEMADRHLLPKETINYVPRFLAIAALCNHRGRNGLHFSWEDPLAWKRLPLSKSIDIRAFAREAQIPYEILKTGNNELNSDLTPPGYTDFHLKVPARYVSAAREALGKTALVQDGEVLPHIVRKGETFWDIALAYGVPYPSLKALNKGISAWQLKVGQAILVPGRAPSTSLAFSQKRDSRFSSLTLYTVKRGDSLWDIARSHSISLGDLALWNGRRVHDLLLEGTVLRVPKRQ